MAAIALAVVWAICVANLTLFAVPGAGPRNLIPLRTIGSYLADGTLPFQIRVRNLVGNLAMLAPLGLVLAAVTKMRLPKVVLCLFVTSVAIETWQLIAATGRSVDIDDVLLNVVGGVLGWFLGLVLLGVLGVVHPTGLAQHRAASGIDARSRVDA